jgi:hypothetical protein
MGDNDEESSFDPNQTRYKVRPTVPGFRDPLSAQVNIPWRPVDVCLGRGDAH